MRAKILVYALPVLILATIHLAEAQQPKKVPRIGYLTIQFGRGSPNEEAFRQGLRDLGYDVEGQNIAIEYRSSEGNSDRLPALAAELVRLNVDIIFAQGGSQVVIAAKNATSSIPIVFVATTDPVATGLVASLARPAGTATGLTIGAPGLYGKRLELLKETLPRLAHVGFLLNSANPTTDVALKEIQAAGQALSVQVYSLDVRSPNDFVRAFEAATKAQVGALVVAEQAPMNTNRKQIVELAAKRRLPTIYGGSNYVEAGGVMSYGVSIADLFRRAATYVDKILKGAKPADLPVEQPMKFELVINLKAAKQIGLTISPNVLARADKVIK